MGRFCRCSWAALGACVAVAGLFSMAAFFAGPGVARGDRGSIPFKPSVQIFEPNQRAIIAWNGNKQILLLSTDLRASEKTKILEVLPLPSEPKVEKGSIRSFKVATRIINSHRRDHALGLRARARTRSARPASPAGKVTFYKKIGAHHISVTKVLNGRRFISWVRKYLATKGYKRARIPSKLVKVVKEYIRDGFKWFVFDIVEVGKRQVTTDAIKYTFDTNQMYYPLRITKTETGHTKVKLIVLTPYLFNNSAFVGLPGRRIRVPHSPVSVTRAELKRISKDMYKLLGRRDSYRLRIWEIGGRLDSFKKDLLCRAGPSPTTGTPKPSRKSPRTPWVKNPHLD